MVIQQTLPMVAAGSLLLVVIALLLTSCSKDDRVDDLNGDSRNAYQEPPDDAFPNRISFMLLDVASGDIPPSSVRFENALYESLEAAYEGRGKYALLRDNEGDESVTIWPIVGRNYCMPIRLNSNESSARQYRLEPLYQMSILVEGAKPGYKDAVTLRRCTESGEEDLPVVGFEPCESARRSPDALWLAPDALYQIQKLYRSPLTVKTGRSFSVSANNTFPMIELGLLARKEVIVCLMQERSDSNGIQALSNASVNLKLPTKRSVAGGYSEMLPVAASSTSSRGIMRSALEQYYSPSIIPGDEETRDSLDTSSDVMLTLMHNEVGKRETTLASLLKLPSQFLLRNESKRSILLQVIPGDESLGTLGGRVSGPDDQPIEGARVVFWRSDLTAHAITNAKGRYTFRGTFASDVAIKPDKRCSVNVTSEDGDTARVMWWPNREIEKWAEVRDFRLEIKPSSSISLVYPAPESKVKVWVYDDRASSSFIKNREFVAEVSEEGTIDFTLKDYKTPFIIVSRLGESHQYDITHSLYAEGVDQVSKYAVSDMHEARQITVNIKNDVKWDSIAIHIKLKHSGEWVDLDRYAVAKGRNQVTVPVGVDVRLTLTSLDGDEHVIDLSDASSYSIE